ncbi:hypothetical protein GMRT_10511 [Giardia muris]|uniref:Uncharacterized protein n=1 Tax=Giardia muris TaxID=5742 RepID=A0A4Z1SS65_GIAMU|nr:hypothetical protein GMRT_10511 [Giardia muris]|eukprot:TNJ26498.1 hypothetical protein GMRT_10511 [Giardia muris]
MNEALKRLDQLYSATGSENDTEYVAEATAFLASWPYCFNIWGKLAFTTLRTEGIQSALDVFGRAIEMAPHCVQIWEKYSEFLNSQHDKLGEHGIDGDETFRGVCEAGLRMVGDQFYSTGLWAEYLRCLPPERAIRISLALLSGVPGVGRLLEEGSIPITNGGEGVIRANMKGIFDYLNTLTSESSEEGKLGAKYYRERYLAPDSTYSTWKVLEKRSFYTDLPLRTHTLQDFRSIFDSILQRLTGLECPTLTNVEGLIGICADYVDFWLGFCNRLSALSVTSTRETQKELLLKCRYVLEEAIQRCHPPLEPTVLRCDRLILQEVLEEMFPDETFNGLAMAETLVQELRLESSAPELLVAAAHYYNRREAREDVSWCCYRILERPVGTVSTIVLCGAAQALLTSTSSQDQVSTTIRDILTAPAIGPDLDIVADACSSLLIHRDMMKGETCSSTLAILERLHDEKALSDEALSAAVLPILQEIQLCGTASQVWAAICLYRRHRDLVAAYADALFAVKGTAVGQE